MDRNQFDATVILTSEGTFSKKLREENIQVKVIDLPLTLIRLKRGKALRSFLFLIGSLFLVQLFLIRLCIYFKKNKFRLILTNTVKAHLYGSIAAYLCSTPLIWRFHDILSSADFSPFMIRLISLFGKLFPRRILAVSNITKEYLVKSGLQSSKVDVIFNGVNSERFESKNISKTIRNELKIENGVKLIGCIGRIVPQKGQKSFLLAIPGVIQKYPETFFLIIGDVFLKEMGYKAELLKIIEENNIKDHIKFTGFRMDVEDVIKSLDIVVFPSVAPESFGLSILEAMYLEKPVVASNIGGVCELIKDGMTGMLIEFNHPEQITDRIIYLLSHKEKLAQIGQKAKEMVREKFPLKNYVGSMERTFKEIALKRVNV